MTARKPAKAWTAHDTAAMRELVALNWTDGRIAEALGVVRLTVWRRRTALGLDRADHPRKENRIRMALAYPHVPDRRQA
jgi:hypothetical protein